MRAQTNLDFLIGISIFLMATVFVFSFVPGMLEPFAASPQERVVIADRAASQLAGGMLGDPAEPYVLNTTCTVAFFDDSKDSSDCAFDNSDPVTDRLGIPSRRNLNITMERNMTDGVDEEVLCWDGDELIANPPGGCGDAVLQRGDSPPTDSQSVTTARRIVYIEEKDAILRVRVW